MGVSILKPDAVLPGARVAAIPPASSAKPERLDAGIAALQALGYDVVEGRSLRGRSPQFFSGTVEERLEDLHWAFADADIEAIFCSRGGYGSNYVLERLDPAVVRANPKPFFAYSDMTVLQSWLLDRTGLVSFHGPMIAADFYRSQGVHLESLEAALSGEVFTATRAEGLETLRAGRVSGTLYGGCLSMLVSTLGTPFSPETEGKLLFLEDVNAKPYQVDRMLRHLILAGKLDGVKGIIFGEMLDCTSPGSDQNLLKAAILRVLDWFEGPIGFGLRSGHVSAGNVTLPFGIEARLHLEEKEATLEWLESPVKS